MRDRSFTDSDGLHVLPVVVMCSSKETMDGMKCVANCVPPALSTENIPSETAERGRGVGVGWLCIIDCAGMGQHANTRSRSRDDGRGRRGETDGGKNLRYFFLGTYCHVVLYLAR